MGTLNPYRAPFLDGNWIIDTGNTISVNHFQLYLISEMFEMFVLLINELILVAFALLLFFLSSCVKLSHTEDALHYLLYCIFENLPWEFAARICRDYLSWEFAAGICRGYLPREFAVGFLYV